MDLIEDDYCTSVPWVYSSIDEANQAPPPPPTASCTAEACKSATILLLAMAGAIFLTICTALELRTAEPRAVAAPLIGAATLYTIAAVALSPAHCRPAAPIVTCPTKQ